MTQPHESSPGPPAGPLVAFLRHGLTDWNKQGRLQGRLDVPLCPEGREIVRRWRLPPELAAWRWSVSPLGRARETAALLGLTHAAIQPALVERSWGSWEGRRLADLAPAGGQAIADAEALGLDFRPPDGETQREVQERLRPFLARCAAGREPAGALCHKGLITAIMALALGWDMRSAPPVRLDWNAIHLFQLGPDGTPQVAHLNRSLLPLDSP